MTRPRILVMIIIHEYIFLFEKGKLWTTLFSSIGL
jgi:hypothetical protein